VSSNITFYLVRVDGEGEETCPVAVMNRGQAGFIDAEGGMVVTITVQSLKGQKRE